MPKGPDATINGRFDFGDLASFLVVDNRQFRSRLRNALKSIRASIDGNDLAGAKTGLKATISLIDKMASKGIIHRNAAGRYKSRLTTRIAKKAS